MFFHFLIDLVCLYVTGNTTMDLLVAKFDVMSGGTSQVVGINFLFGSVNITAENLNLWMCVSAAITGWILWDLFKAVHHFWNRFVSKMADEKIAQ